ncbi:MAG TPA: T9SS type A sorting domain-containing protein [Flavobacteriales bacterium]|nr:T9SS type A sorting domain-containing protein [Flavobacteriales bacterium]
MEKLFTLSIIAATIATASTAQTLTQANSIPAVGTSELRTYYSQFSAITLATSSSGNSWDATGVQPFGVVETVVYRAPGDSPFAATYPATTVCMQRNASTPSEEWRHYRADAAVAELLGTGTDTFDGGRTFCTYPFSLGSTFTDDYSINGGATNTETDEYVANGEIIAPWGTIPNVVMFSVNGGLSYYFYSATNVLDAIGSYTPGFGMDLWKVDVSTGVTESNAAVIGVRSLSNASFVISVPGTDRFTFSVIDASGRVVLNESSASATATIDMSAQATGAYTVVATPTSGQRSVARIVVLGS